MPGPYSPLQKQKQRESLRCAQAALERRQQQHLTFHNVRDAVRWYCETRPRMSSANALHPKTEKVDDFGTRVPINVDGGRGGDLDETLATLATVTAALDRLRVYNPTWHQVVLAKGCGESQAVIGRTLNQRQQIVSKMLSWGEAYLAALLGGPDGVLRHQQQPVERGRRELRL